MPPPFAKHKFFQMPMTIGRGYEIYDFPVELEPVFPKVFPSRQNQTPADNGRIPSFFDRLFASKQSIKLLLTDDPESENPPPTQPRKSPDIKVISLQVNLPRELKISSEQTEHLLLNLANSASFISFEIIGTCEAVTFQITCPETEKAALLWQLKSHVPTADFRESDDLLKKHLLTDKQNHIIAADFGLAREWFVSLPSGRSFAADTLLPLIALLEQIKDKEIACLQILFTRARQNWQKYAWESITDKNGKLIYTDLKNYVSGIKEKLSNPLLAARIRFIAQSHSKEISMRILRRTQAFFRQFSAPSGNELIPLVPDSLKSQQQLQSLLNRTTFRSGILLSAQELSAIIHLPADALQSKKLHRNENRSKTAPEFTASGKFNLGANVYAGKKRIVSLSAAQRVKHTHLIGATGSGKSTLLLNLIKQDLEAGQGFCVIDPHGDLIDETMANVPDERLKDVVMFDPSDSEYPIGFNILQAQSELEKTVLASDLIATFRRMSTSWGDVMDSVLANAILAFVESNHGGTLFELKRFLVEKEFRNEFLNTVEDETVRYFWQNEFPTLSGKPQSSILIRLDTFLRQKIIRNIVCQRETNLNFREVMDNRKVLLIKLSQGLIGEENALLLGTLLVSKIYQTAMTRQDTLERPFFWLYLDEFHHFITPSMESILSGARKYNLGLVLAHQEFRQLQSRSLDVASSVLSNCYTRICFRLGDNDAERFASGFSFFDTKALQNLGVGEAVGRIERAEYDFNLSTYPAPEVHRETAEKRKAEIIRNTRELFAKPKAEVEAELKIAPKTESVIASVTEIKPPQPENQVIPTSPSKEVPKDNSDEYRKPLPPQRENAELSGFPASVPTKDSASEKGTPQHKYLQSLVKRMAESKGFLVTIEKEVFGGIGKIDVSLKSESRKIACEISVTNEPDYELQNIQKCLSASYSPVIVISADKRHLDRIRQKAEESLSAEDFAKTEFFLPEEFHLWLENLGADDAESEEKVKGFRVKVKLKPVDESDRPARQKAISDVVFGGLKKLKNKGKKE